MFLPENLEIDLFSTFGEAEGAWRAFERDAAFYAFQSFDWLSTWHKHIGEADAVEPAIVLVRYPLAAPLMLLPFGVRKTGGCRVLCWMGGKVTDYHGPLIDRPKAELLTPELFLKLWKRIREALPRHDAIRLEKQPADIEGIPNPFLALSAKPNASSAHATRLGADIDAFIASKASGKRRWQMRRKADKLSELGEIAVAHPTAPAEIDRVLEALFVDKGRSYNEMGVENIFDKPEYRAFYREMAHRHAASGFVDLSALTLDGKVIASHWGVVHRARYYFLMPAYADGEISRFSPGVQLLRHLFEWAMARHVQVFDFTIGDEAYKAMWCESELSLFDYVGAANVRGAPYSAALVAYLGLKRTIKRSPKLWRGFEAVRSRLRLGPGPSSGGGS